MSEMISVATGFQYSVNIGYDLTSDDKLKNFIPTKSALSLLEEILLSTETMSTERARVLIGAYGKGKSHIVLTILAILMKRDINLFEKMLPKIEERVGLSQRVENYYDSDKKLLPIVITGSNTSIPQAFLLALQRTLAEHDFMDIMPETNYKAAVAVINRWSTDFPETYAQFKSAIDGPIEKFLQSLDEYSIESYEEFEKIYPTLTAGSLFNPFLGFDVIDLYESAIKGLRTKGYTGVYVVYDEFSKFLESNISAASVSDTKMLQDFAEKCNRSGEFQMHLMLISHKEIANYIDTLPKQKVDGWRGVSERFRHIHLNNNFSQTYEIISTVIQKDTEMWAHFNRENGENFKSLKQRYLSHSIFKETSKTEIKKIINPCYPLHPVSTFILPRLSERVAQNERTLFTFLSSSGPSTLSEFLKQHDDSVFSLIEPDVIYDYFEPLLKKEVYGSDLHSTYILTTVILDKLPHNSLEKKLVKTLSLIYILGQFELLQPTRNELVGIYATRYSIEEIEISLNRLIEEEYVIYLKRKNQFLQLKQSSGVDIRKKIQDAIAHQTKRTSIKDTLNSVNFDKYMYPSRYNDEREMTRYFSFEFVSGDELNDNVNWNIKSESVDGDGIIYGIIPNGENEIASLHDSLLVTSQGHQRYIFVLPTRYVEIETVIKEFNAVQMLKDAAIGDRILFEEYETVYEDLRELIGAFITSYTHPEDSKANYIHNGTVCTITRKAALTSLMSTICDDIFAFTPVVNNEAVNRNEITAIARNSRDKIVAGLLRNELEPDLGLAGFGQEVSIMRSTLIRTGILMSDDQGIRINLQPADEMMCHVLSEISNFFIAAQQQEKISFATLYDVLTTPSHRIGLRKGLIPIYLAAVLHEYKQDVVISDRSRQVPSNADVLMQINATPDAFYISYLGWDIQKAQFVQQLDMAFKDYVVDAERAINAYDYIALAMRRWYMSLPKYVREAKRLVDGSKIETENSQMIRLLKQGVGSYSLLFDKLPDLFHKVEVNAELAAEITSVKLFYDSVFGNMKSVLIAEVKSIFVMSDNGNAVSRCSLASVIKDWCDYLEPKVFNQLFPNGADRCLGLFKTITNDEDTFISRLAKIATDLRLEDWDDSTFRLFQAKLKIWKETAEMFQCQENDIAAVESEDYQVTFTNDEGMAITKRFERVKCSNRAKLLYNAITGQLAGMGQSISEQEKRQVLMEILEKLC